MLFCQANRQDIKEKYPHLSATEIMSSLGQLWSSLTDDEKGEWGMKADQAKELLNNSAVDGGENEEEALDFSDPEEEEEEEEEAQEQEEVQEEN